MMRVLKQIITCLCVAYLKHIMGYKNMQLKLRRFVASIGVNSIKCNKLNVLDIAEIDYGRAATARQKTYSIHM